MKKIAYFDCFSGISGDMTLAALVDAGADEIFINNELKKILVEPSQLKFSQTIKKGMTAKKLEIIINPDINPARKNYTDIKQMIELSELSKNVKERSLKIFKTIGMAEAKIHGISLEKVHFHEIGAIDSIIDIIGACLALENLGIDEIYSSQIPVGTGEIKIEHGIYPNPAPATLEILKGTPIRFSNINYEMTTPTGAGIIASLRSSNIDLPSIIIENIGYGAGTKDFTDRPNVLRVIVGRIEEQRFKKSHFHFHEYSEVSLENDIHITK